MTDRAHINGTDLVALYQGEKGRFVHDGVVTEPILIGFESGTHKIVPASVITNDTSTGPDTITEDTGWVVAPDASEVTRTLTIRDMTAQEITDRDNVEKDAAEVEFDSDRKFRAIEKALFHIINGTAPATVTEAQLRSFLRNNMDP